MKIVMPTVGDFLFSRLSLAASSRGAPGFFCSLAACCSFCNFFAASGSVGPSIFAAVFAVFFPLSPLIFELFLLHPAPTVVESTGAPSATLARCT